MEKHETFERVKTILILMALTIATLTVYWQVQSHDFINYDDPVYIGNPMVWKGLSWESLKWAFQSTMEANWHPLTWISLMLDFELFGKKPAGYHLTNLFFHLANTLMLFLILKEMTVTYWRSAFVAAVFAIHPLHVESVAWVAERKDVLSAFFFFLTIIAYVQYLKKPAIGKYLLSLFLYIFGLMSKPMLVTLPFVLLLLDFWPLGRVSSDDIEQHRLWPAISPLLIEKIPFFICSIISSVITYYVQSKGGAVSSLQFIPFRVRISNAFISYADYLDKTLWPRDLAIFYPYSNTILLSKALGAALIILFISLFAVYSMKRIPYLFVGWFWYLGTLVPVIGIVQVGIQASADRYTYLPLIGISLILAWGVSNATRSMPYRRVTLFSCAFILLANWTFMALRQASYWKDNISLYEHAISVTRENYLAHVNLGTALSKAGKNDEAMRHFQEAFRINPSDAGSLNKMGILFVKSGKTEEATSYFRKALKFNPSLESANVNLGVILAKDMTPESQAEAMALFNKALSINPRSEYLHNNLAGQLLLQGKAEEALSHLEVALRINPNFATAHFNSGKILEIQGRLEEAISHFREVLRIDPANQKAIEALRMATSNMFGNKTKDRD